MLDGAARVGDLVAEVARQEMPAIAMTDHGNVFGAFDFYKQAKKAGVNPSSVLKRTLRQNLDLKNVELNGRKAEMMMSLAVVLTRT